MEKNILSKVGVTAALALSFLSEPALSANSSNKDLQSCADSKLKDIKDGLYYRPGGFGFGDKFNNATFTKGCIDTQGTNSQADRLFRDYLDPKNFKSDGKYKIDLYNYPKNKYLTSYCVIKQDKDFGFCLDGNGTITDRSKLNSKFRDNLKPDLLSYERKFLGKAKIPRQTNPVRKVIKAKVYPKNNNVNNISSDGIYLSLNSSSSKITKFTENGEGFTAQSSIGTVDGILKYGSKTKMSSSNVLKDFYIAGAVRGSLGQGKLTSSYQRGLEQTGGNGLNIGVSSLNGKSAELNALVGQKACDYKNNCHTITNKSLADSLRFHAIAESVASIYRDTQNLDNGYSSDVSRVVNLDKVAYTLSQNPLIRPILPINMLVQGSRGLDYTQHLTNKNVSEQMTSNESLENRLLGLDLVGFENKVSSNVKGYYSGGKD